jgi:hypothetical protein
MDGFLYRAVTGEVFGVPLPVAELEGLVPDKAYCYLPSAVLLRRTGRVKAKGGTTEKLKLGKPKAEMGRGAGARQ